MRSRLSQKYRPGSVDIRIMVDIEDGPNIRPEFISKIITVDVAIICYSMAISDKGFSTLELDSVHLAGNVLKKDGTNGINRHCHTVRWSDFLKGSDHREAVPKELPEMTTSERLAYAVAHRYWPSIGTVLEKQHFNWSELENIVW